MTKQLQEITTICTHVWCFRPRQCKTVLFKEGVSSKTLQRAFSFWGQVLHQYSCVPEPERFFFNLLSMLHLVPLQQDQQTHCVKRGLTRQTVDHMFIILCGRYFFFFLIVLRWIIQAFSMLLAKGMRWSWTKGLIFFHFLMWICKWITCQGCLTGQDHECIWMLLAPQQCEMQMWIKLLPPWVWGFWRTN